MNHSKDDVIPAADGLWPEILQGLTGIESSVFSGKHQPCKLCGGKDRFRYIKKYDHPFHCGQCGAKTGIQFYMEYAGIDFSTAINDVGDYLNLIPVDRREAIKRDFEIATSYPDWYKFDKEVYDKVKSQAEVKLSQWQRISGLNVIDALSVEKYALFPLLNEKGKECDFVMIDINGNWQTTGGNTIIPDGYYSVFGVNAGKRAYICVNPYYAAHASISMQCQVVCCYELSNLWSVAAHFIDSMEVMVIVTNIEETKEADSIKLNQLTFDKTKRTVGRHFYKPFQICDKIKERGKNE